jgi:type IV pilus assembly protein PilO
MALKLQSVNFGQLPTAGKSVLLVLLLGVLSAGYYLALHMGLQDETAASVQKHSALERELQQARDRQKEYLKLREEVSAREALDKQNLRILPVTAEIPAFLDDLNRLAELSGLRMEQVTPSAESKQEFYTKVPVALSVRGRFHELAKFFYNVSRLERAINMEDIKVNVAARESDGAVQLAVNVRATTFRRNP